MIDVCEALEMAEGIGCDLYLYLLRAWIDSSWVMKNKCDKSLVIENFESL